MKIFSNLLEVNEMTRSKERLLSVKKVIISPVYYIDMVKYLESLKYQDEKYLSYHYGINNDGKILNFIPESEVSYPTNNIKFNLECISVSIYLKSKSDQININEEESLIYLIKSICNKYNLQINKDVVILYDICCTREFEYYIDNYCEFIGIKEKKKNTVIK